MYKLVVNYLRKLNYTSKIEDFQDFFKSHPNYPSLLAITDGLSYLSIENLAANFPLVHFDELPDSFIAELNFEIQDLFLITKVGEKIITEDKLGNIKIISKEEIEKSWTGTILLIEENEKVEVNNVLKDSKSYFLFLIIFLSVLSIIIRLENNLHTILLIISAIGVLVTFEILKTYFNAKSNLESKLCSINKDFSCNSIIKSKSYPFSRYIEFVDLPVLFFGFSFISLLIGLKINYIIGLISLFSLPLIFYSIYLQKFYLQKWCALCLVISGLLIINAIIFLVYYESIVVIQAENIINAIVVFVLIVFFWFIIKKWIKKFNLNESNLNQLFRFKRSEEIFNNSLKSLVNLDTFYQLDSLIIGNLDAKNTITLFISPSCPHCFSAYKDSKELLSKYPDDIKLQIMYNLNVNNHDNPYIDIPRALFKIKEENIKQVKIALDDWHIKEMSIDEWKNKWKIDEYLEDIDNTLKTHYNWCYENEFNYAPVKIFNGYLLGNQYEINELFYFFKE